MESELEFLIQYHASRVLYMQTNYKIKLIKIIEFNSYPFFEFILVTPEEGLIQAPP